MNNLSQRAFPNQGSPLSREKLLFVASGPTTVAEAEPPGEGPLCSFFPCRSCLSCCSYSPTRTLGFAEPGCPGTVCNVQWWTLKQEQLAGLGVRARVTSGFYLLTEKRERDCT